MHRISCGSARADPSLTAGRSDEAFRTARDRWPREHCRHDGDRSAVPSSAAGRHQRPFTFSGQCQLSGTVAFSPRLSTSAGPVRNSARATGTCSGSATDRRGHTTQLNGAPVGYRATEVGSQESCQLNTNAPGSGELLFKAGRLRFRIVENRVGPTASLSLTGRRGGSAGAIAAVNSPDPAGVLEQCAMGGIASVPVDLAIQTAPTISG
jgi:hypothetical protein